MYGGDLMRLFSNQTQRPGKDKKTWKVLSINSI
jgi:hypothetical protein